MQPLSIRIKTKVHKALKLAVQTLRTNLKLTFEYEFHVLTNTEFNTAKDHGKVYIKVKRPLVRHLLHNIY